MPNPTPDFKIIREEVLLQNNSPFNVHDNLKHLPLDEIKDIANSYILPYVVMAINVTGDMNIGTIIRNSHIFSAEKIIIYGRKYDRRGTVGSENYINVERVNAMDIMSMTYDEKEFVEYMHINKYVPIFIETGGEILGSFSWKERMKPIYDAGYKPCFVFGNEGSGIPENLLNIKFDNSFIVGIKQRGVIRSLNVSVSNGIIEHDFISNMGWL
jgi:tRNA G18 (ribose-2'-O)-methylase SpoU